MKSTLEQPQQTVPESSSPSAGFASLGLRPELLTALEALGYEEPTPIQREAIPLLLAGRDLLGLAATGTGKTAAFALPLLHRLPTKKSEPSPSALVLVPTRELAMQVSEAVHRYGRELHVTVLPIYGGQAYGQQLRSLKRGVDVVVATPGRALDHLNRKTLRLEHVQMVVLDEADEMLDMGFAEDLEAILSATPTERQTALFSATMPPRIAEIARRHLKDPAELKIPRERLAKAAKARVRQTAFIVPRANKLTALSRILDMENPTSALVFCRTRIEVDELAERLNSHGYEAGALHGGMTQQQRDRVLDKFRSGRSELLIATDVAARGLDIRHLSHVINYDVPATPDSYVHRIGRTGRAGAEGVAITIAEPRESRLLRNIEQTTKSKFEMASVPTVADLQARRLDLLRGSVEELLRQGNLDSFRGAVQSLGQEFDLLDIAAAALKLAQGARGDSDEQEQDIPAIAPRSTHDRSSSRRESSREQNARPERARKSSPHPRTAERGHHDDGKYPPRNTPRSDNRASQKDSSHKPAVREKPAVAASRSGPTIKLQLGGGRKIGLGPADIVGAIVKEVGVPAKAIGDIEIADKFSIVVVPEDRAKDVIRILRKTGIKNKKMGVRVFKPEL